MENTETDIEKLKKEIDDLKMENYILKKKLYSIKAIITDDAEIKLKGNETTIEEFKKLMQKYRATLLIDMDISFRSLNCLKRHAGIITLGDLLQYSKSDLLNIKNFGRKCLKETEEALATYGLELKK